MSRLKQYRELMVSLDPGGDPRVALQKGWGVDRPNSSVATAVAARIELEPWSCHLIVGGTGSGKTTELRRLGARLTVTAQESKDVVEYVDLALWTRLEQVQAGVLVSVVGTRLAMRSISLHSDSGTKEPKAVAEAREAVRRLAHGFVEYIGPDAWERPDDDGPDDDYDDGPPMIVNHVDGVLRPPQTPMHPRVAHIVPRLQTLRQSVASPDGHCVFMVDSLDRVADLASLEVALFDDVRALKAAGIGVTIVGPIRLRYGATGDLAELFDGNVHSLAEVEPCAAGLSFLVEVLTRRASAELVSLECKQELARGSGGVLRDLISLAKAAAQEAYLAGAAAVGLDHVAAAIEQRGRALAVGLDSEEVLVLKKVNETNGLVIRGARELTLLETRRVLDYGGGRFAVHPALARLLDLMTVAA